MSEEWTLLVDASVFITLTEVDAISTLLNSAGELAVPEQVAHEISEDPAARRLEQAVDEDEIAIREVMAPLLLDAATRLNRELSETEIEGRRHATVEGDIALLGLALSPRADEMPGEFVATSPVVVTDDKPLRQACEALSIPVSGSIGVLVRAVERGDIGVDDAKDKLEAMDEVGARLSASLYRKAERMIEDAAEE